MKKLPFSQIVCADYETVWDSKTYTLRKLDTTDYIVDPRFGIHCASVRTARSLKVYRTLKQAKIDWSRTAFLAHHCHFDALIAAHHEGIRPAFYLDTLSMARLLHGSVYPLGLDLLAKRYGLPGKRYGKALVNTNGKTILTPQEYRELAEYAGDDADQEWQLYHLMRPHVSDDELRFIDLSIRMYVDPQLCMDTELVQRTLDIEVKRKAELYAAVKSNAKALGSANSFAALLRKAGVEPPLKTKIDKDGNEKTSFAFAKNDLAFKALLGHRRKGVRQLVQARMAAKSSLIETRATKFLSRAHLPRQPVYSRPYAARTLRDGGGDGTNFKNLPRSPKPGAKLREALMAPPKHKIIVKDQAQIERRLACFVSGQDSYVEAFRAADEGRGPDVYRFAAASFIYKKSVDEITTDERFVGKTAELGLQYQAGPAKFAYMLRVGQFGPPVDITDEESVKVVRDWRKGNDRLSARYGMWKQIERAATQAFVTNTQIEFADGLITFEGYKGTGYMHLPNGTYVRYDDIERDDEGKLSYLVKLAKKKGVEHYRKKIYGGILFENFIQALSRVMLAKYALQIHEEVPQAKIVMMTYDEIVAVHPERGIITAEKKITEIMRRRPDWLPGIPLNVSGGIYDRYVKE